MTFEDKLKKFHRPNIRTKIITFPEYTEEKSFVKKVLDKHLQHPKHELLITNDKLGFIKIKTSLKDTGNSKSELPG